MSSALDDALSNSERRANLMVERSLRGARESVTHHPMVPSTPIIGSGLANSSRGQSTFHASEQYRHFTGWVYASVRPIAQRIAGQPIRVARLAKKGSSKFNRPHKDTLPSSLKAFAENMDIIDNHPVLDAINNPNQIMVRWIMIYVTVVSLEITGKAYWWIRPREKDEAEFPGQWEIWPVPSHWMTPVHEDNKLFAKWEIRAEASAEPVVVPGEQIIYFYYPDPADPLNAISPLQTQARAVVADESIQDAQRRGFSNGLHPGMILTVGRHPDVQGMPGQRPILTATQRNQIIAAFKQFYKGVVHYDEPLILDGMIEDAKRFSMTNREMDFLNSGKQMKERISQGFGTNPIVMGQVEGANRASSTMADEHFCSSTVNPKITLISECLTAWMGPLFSNSSERYVIYLEPASAYDPTFEIKRQEFLMRNGAVSINEVRGMNNLPPIVGGDVCMVSNLLMPVNIIREDEPNPGSLTFLPEQEPQTPGQSQDNQNQGEGDQNP